MNTLPKSKCPPAKPPRRKLSYSSESGKGNSVQSDSSLTLIHPLSETDKINETKKPNVDGIRKVPEDLKTELASRNQNLSKSSSSASSASKESGGSPFTDVGSDYGSFQGDQLNLPSSDGNADYLTQWPITPSKSRLRTPQKALFNNFASEVSATRRDRHCCSSSTPIKLPLGHGGLSLTPHFTPNTKNNSVYYTPPCNTPCSRKYPNDENSFSNESIVCDLPIKPICCGIERRHNSDPQISLERRPSRRSKSNGKSSLLSRGKRTTCGDESSRRKKRSQSFVCNQHHHHHHHHHETEVNDAPPHVLVFPQPSLCCLDSWRKSKIDSCGDSLEDICHRIWKKHQSQSQSQPEWSGGTKTPNNTAGNFSELLAEIYYAQKERDKASQERLEMVIEQRNKLMAEVESLKQIIFRQNIWRNECTEEESDCDTVGLDQLLKGLDETYSPTKLEFHKDQILAKVNRASRGRKSQLSSLNSRRGSSQPQSLMDELNNPREIWNCDGFVCQKVSEERSKAMAAMHKMTEMEDDLSSLRLYSLQNTNGSLNGHDSSKSQEQLPKLHSDDDDDDDEEEEIGVFHIDSVNSNIDEELRVKLQKEIKARHEAEDNCKKLERLVNVLRKKIAGINIGVQV